MKRAVAALFVTSLASAADVRAERGMITLAVHGCSGLDPAELTRLTTLELSSVLEATRAQNRYEVGVACDGNVVRLTITDPLTRKTLARVVGAPPAPEPERVLALAVAQLYRASWLELMTEDAAGSPGREPEANTAEGRAIDTALERVRRPRMRHEFSLALGARALSVPTSVVLPRLGVAYTDWLSTVFGFGGRASAELGSVARAAGDVDVRLLHVGVHAAMRSAEFGAFAVQGALGVVATHIHMAGRPGAAGARSATIDGLRPDFFAEVGPAVTFGPILLGIEGEAGFLPRAPRGSVPDGPTVRVDGLWLGALLSLSVGPAWL